MTTERFPLPQPPYDPKVQEAFDKVQLGALAPMNFLRTLAHQPRILGNVVALGGTLMYRGALPERLREIAIFRVAALTRCNYEWAMHRALFEKKCGLTEAQVDSLRNGNAEGGWTEEEALVIAATEELHRDSTVSEATWKRLRAHWEPPVILELLMVVGYYHMLAYFLNATGAAPEEGARHLAAF